MDAESHPSIFTPLKPSLMISSAPPTALHRTGIPSDNIMFFIATMKEIYDVCSLTYSCENYMWKAYSNNSRGICLVFNVIDYDMLYPVEYVDKNKVDYTEMLIEA